MYLKFDGYCLEFVVCFWRGGFLYKFNPAIALIKRQFYISFVSFYYFFMVILNNINNNRTVMCIINLLTENFDNIIEYNFGIKCSEKIMDQNQGPAY